MSSPFEYNKAGDDAHHAEEDQGIDQPGHLCDGGTRQRAAEDGNVENNGVPGQMRGAVIWRDIFEHVVDVGTIDHGKEKAAKERKYIELKYCVRCRQHEGI